MDYFVIAPDGQEYGPASLDTLRGWVAENRVLPTTMLKDAQSGLTAPASSVGNLFPLTPPPSMAPGPAPQSSAMPPGNWSQPPTASYPRGGPAGPGGTGRYYQDDGKMDVVWAIVRSALALVFFFVFQGLGLIIGIYAVIYAFRARDKGHKLANVGIAISVTTVIIIGIGWILRIGNGMPSH